MSGTPINLNRVRKARARDDAKRQADTNAVKHGRTRAQRDLDAARRAKAEEGLAGHERSDD